MDAIQPFWHTSVACWNFLSLNLLCNENSLEFTYFILLAIKPLNSIFTLKVGFEVKKKYQDKKSNVQPAVYQIMISVKKVDQAICFCVQHPIHLKIGISILVNTLSILIGNPISLNFKINVYALPIILSI